MYWYTYVLKSRKGERLYIGCTSNIEKRVNDHNEGKVDATKVRRPFDLIYYEASYNKLRAFKREKYFKTGYGKRFLKNRI